MKGIGSIILILSLGAAILAQQTATVTGTLRDGGRIVRDQVVKLVSGGEAFEAKTDADGVYKFNNVPAGKYLLVYAGKQASVEVSGGQVTTAVLADVVTVSAGESQTIEQVSKTVDVISAQEMRDRADFSLTESLRTIPGFRVAQAGGFGRLATIKTRGLRNQDTALLLDGIRFRDVSAITGDASSLISDFTLTSVSKVEVLRGSGSSLYGTNAVGGVVDFQTPEATSGTHGQIGGAFGGLGLKRFRGNLSHGTSDGRFGITGGVSRTVYSDGIDGDDASHNTNFQTRVDVNPWQNTSISGRIFYSNADVRLNSNPDTLGTLPPTAATIIDAQQGVNFVYDVNDPDNFQRSHFFDGQVSVNQIINSKFLISGYYQGLTTKRTNTNGLLGVGFQDESTSVFDGTVHTGNIHFNWTPNRQNSLTAGYEFESERFGNVGTTPSGTADFFTKAGQKSNTFYAQDLVSLLNGNLQFAGGLRVQGYSLDKPEFSLTNAPYTNLTLTSPPTAFTFDGSASYFVQKSGTKFRAHVGNGYRVPSLYERFGTFFSTFPSNSFVPIGAPDLEPEKTIAFDAGIEQNLADGRVRLSGTYFYTRLTNIIGYGTLPQPDPFGRINALSGGGYLNQTGGIARGVEFSVRAKATTSTDIFASYTFTNTDQLTPQIAGSGVYKTLGVPDDQFTLVVTQRIKRAWINFDFLATSNYLGSIFSNTFFVSRLYRFDGNRKGDLTGGYTFGIKKNESLTLRLYGTIENIFDQEYYENGFRTGGAVGRFGISFGF